MNESYTIVTIFVISSTDWPSHALLKLCGKMEITANSKKYGIIPRSVGIPRGNYRPSIAKKCHIGFSFWLDFKVLWGYFRENSSGNFWKFMDIFGISEISCIHLKFQISFVIDFVLTARLISLRQSHRSRLIQRLHIVKLKRHMLSFLFLIRQFFLSSAELMNQIKKTKWPPVE